MTCEDDENCPEDHYCECCGAHTHPWPRYLSPADNKFICSTCENEEKGGYGYRKSAYQKLRGKND